MITSISNSITYMVVRRGLLPPHRIITNDPFGGWSLNEMWWHPSIPFWMPNNGRTVTCTTLNQNFRPSWMTLWHLCHHRPHHLVHETIIECNHTQPGNGVYLHTSYFSVMIICTYIMYNQTTTSPILPTFWLEQQRQQHQHQQPMTVTILLRFDSRRISCVIFYQPYHM